MSHYTNPKRLWFVERGKLGLVEEGSTTTVDGVSTSIVSISKAKSIVIKGLTTPNHFPIGKEADYNTAYTDNSYGPLSEIPDMFHEALAFKAIAMGYKEPRNMKIELAQYFDTEYEAVVRRAKKFGRSKFLTSGQIVPQEF
jgi:hypothetical protein